MTNIRPLPSEGNREGDVLSPPPASTNLNPALGALKNESTPYEQLMAAARQELAANLIRFLLFLGWKEGEIIELQALQVPRNTAEGRWRDTPCMAAHTAELKALIGLAEEADRWGAQGIYLLPNTIKPAVQYRNEVGRWYDVKKEASTKDVDIEHRRILYLDFDPERAGGVKGISATDEEMKRAIDRMAMARELLGTTIPLGTMGMGLSGNGAALFLSLEPMVPSDKVNLTIKAILVAMAEIFDDEFVKVDTSVSDLKRLCPCFGTTKRKGVHCWERPHRRTAFTCSDAPTRLAALELDRLFARLREQLSTEEARSRVDAILAEGAKKSPKSTQNQGVRPAKLAPSRTKRPVSDEGSEGSAPFRVANSIPIGEVLTQLDLMDGGHPRCPGCEEVDQGVAIVGNGLKCHHHRCASKGYKDGFRTVVDVVMERQQLDCRGALGWLSAHFPSAGIQALLRDDYEEQAEQSGLVSLVVGYDLGRIIRQCEAILAKRVLDLFHQERKLVVVASAGPREGWRDDETTPIPIVVTLPALRALMSDHISFVEERESKEGSRFERCRPHDDITKGVHQAIERTWVRELVQVVRSPFLATVEGKIVSASGYDNHTGCLLLLPSGATPATVPECPTHADAIQARDELVSELLTDFPFATPRDRSVALAAILTLLARPALGSANVPGFVFEAPTKGTGKTRLADTVSIVGVGMSIAKRTYPADEEELKKDLFAMAREARSAACYDNVNTPIGGAALDGVLTCGGRYSGRVLGTSTSQDCHWRTVLFFTANNPVYQGDIGRRVLTCRLDAGVERPHLRDRFKHPDLLRYALERQVHFATLGLIILRAFLQYPAAQLKLKPLGSFEEWTALIATALVWLGETNPCEAIPDASEESPDPVRAALGMLMELWPTLERHPKVLAKRQLMTLGGERPASERLRAQDIIEALYPSGEAPRAEDNELREAIEGLTQVPVGRMPSTKQLGKALSRHRGQVTGGRKLVSKTDRKNVQRWWVETVGGAGFAGSAGFLPPTLLADQVTDQAQEGREHQIATVAEEGPENRPEPANPAPPSLVKDEYPTASLGDAWEEG